MTSIKKIFRLIFFPLELILIFLIYIYKFIISPSFPKSCRFIPTCSTYTILAIKEFGIFVGIFLSIKRLLKCSRCGKIEYDPIPLNIKGDFKWLL